MTMKKYKFDHSKLFFAYEIIVRPHGYNHYRIHRFLSEYEQQQWILEGIGTSTHEIRFNPVTRVGVAYNDPMVQLAINYEHWPIKVVRHHYGDYGLISDASGEFTG